MRAEIGSHFSMTPYTQAIVSCAAVLGVKHAIVTLLCVRARLMSKSFRLSFRSRRRAQVRFGSAYIARCVS